MSINTVPYTNQYIFGRGRAFIGLKDANGVSEGLRPLGNAPDYKITVKANLFQHDSAESGLSENDFTYPTKVTRDSSLTVDNITDPNLALAIAGNLKKFIQSATSVTGEVISKIAVGRHYQIGKTAANPSGVRKVSSVTIALAQAGAASRVSSTPYVVGDFFKSGTNLFVVTVAGSTAASAPSFVTTPVGATTVDGTATVAYIGPATDTYATPADYILDADYALVGIPETGKFAAILGVLPAGTSLDLTCGYTPAAGSRTQLVTGDIPNLKAEFKFIADNPVGENRDVYCADVTITPNGDLSLITADKIMSLSLSISINKLNSQTPALIIDGETVLGS